MASSSAHGSAIRALQKELKDLVEHPVEGFRVSPVDEGNLFVWDVAIFGPPQTIYEGGYFKARLFFPPEYPYLPPSMRFISRMFHPNIYENGEVCISILHPPGEDPRSGEMASERWSPAQNVRTILLSVISMLNEPNIHSSAHINASTAYRDWRESNGRKPDYEIAVRNLVEQTKADAARDNVVVPLTLEDYCSSGRSGAQQCSGSGGGLSDDALDLDDDYFDCDDDTESEDEMSTSCQAAVEDGLIDEGHVGGAGERLIGKVDLAPGMETGAETADGLSPLN